MTLTADIMILIADIMILTADIMILIADTHSRDTQLTPNEVSSC